jgi:hypothetical protein
MSQNSNELAHEIARAFDEEFLLEFYESVVRRYPEDLIRRAYEKAMTVPAERIRKTRGAIFTYLVRQYDRKRRRVNTQDSGD